MQHASVNTRDEAVSPLHTLVCDSADVWSLISCWLEFESQTNKVEPNATDASSRQVGTREIGSNELGQLSFNECEISVEISRTAGGQGKPEAQVGMFPVSLYFLFRLQFRHCSESHKTLLLTERHLITRIFELVAAK
jgi:hypothetical protein